ncbi:MAG: hypothetical protein ACLQG3_14905 [Terracidiphilus sp.]
MTEEMGGTELTERLELIESMIAAGRRGTTKWGWSFVLWGVAYFVATAWSSGWFGGPVWGQHYLAWPVTMIAASIATGVAISRTKKGQPGTALGRAVSAVWCAMGISLFVVLMSLGLSGRYETHVFMAIIGGMLCMANLASAMILKWKMQLACAVVWLGSAVAGCFGTETQAGIAFLAATFLCQIVFGIYAMILESRRRQGAANA